MVKGYGKITTLVKFDKTRCKYCKFQFVRSFINSIRKNINDTDGFTSNQNIPIEH